MECKISCYGLERSAIKDCPTYISLIKFIEDTCKRWFHKAGKVQIEVYCDDAEIVARLPDGIDICRNKEKEVTSVSNWWRQKR